jgi:hypothetical protein
VHEHIFTAIVANDEAEALLAVEEFYDARAFADDLGGHAATRSTAAAAATKSAAATATAAETTAAAAAEPAAITATEAAATAAAISTAAAATEAAAAAIAVTATEAAATTAEIVAAETVALITPATATIAAATFIETHALFVFPVRPISQSRTSTSDDGRRPSGANQERLYCVLAENREARE